MELKRIVVPFELKSADLKAGTFEGYAAVYGNIDHGGDVILPGAFKATIAERKGKVPLYFNHNHLRGDMPIGTASVEEDARGIKTLGFPLVDEVQAAREGMALVKAGALMDMSIGYRAREFKRDPGTGVRSIARADLFEVSIVGTGGGMNPLAGVTAVKSLDEIEGAEALVEMLTKGAPLSPEFARSLAALAFPAVSSELEVAEAKDAGRAIRALLEVIKS